MEGRTLVDLDPERLPCVLLLGQQRRLLMRSPASYHSIPLPESSSSLDPPPLHTIPMSSRGNSLIDLASQAVTGGDLRADLTKKQHTAPLLIADGTCLPGVPADALAAVLGERQFLGLFAITIGPVTLIGHPIVLFEVPHSSSSSSLKSPATGTGTGTGSSPSAPQQASYAFVLLVVPPGCQASKERMANALTTLVTALQHLEHHDQYVTSQSQALNKLVASRAVDAEWSLMLKPKGPRLAVDLEVFGAYLAHLALFGSFPTRPLAIAGSIQVILSTPPLPLQHDAPRHVAPGVALKRIGVTLPLIPSGHTSVVPKKDLLHALALSDVIVPRDPASGTTHEAVSLVDIFPNMDDILAKLGDPPACPPPVGLNRTYPATLPPLSAAPATLDRLVPLADVYNILESAARERLFGASPESNPSDAFVAATAADAARAAVSILLDTNTLRPRAEHHVAFFPSVSLTRDNGAPERMCPFGTAATCGCQRTVTIDNGDGVPEIPLQDAWFCTITGWPHQAIRSSDITAYTARGMWRGSLSWWPVTVVVDDQPPSSGRESPVQQDSAPVLLTMANVDMWWKRVGGAVLGLWLREAASVYERLGAGRSMGDVKQAAERMTQLTARIADAAAASTAGTLPLAECHALAARWANVSVWEGSLLVHAVLSVMYVCLRTVTRRVSHSP